MARKPKAANDLPAETLLHLFTEMLRIRRFEETAIYHSTTGDLYGALHVCIGEEATPVGVCHALRRDDFIVSTHRGHGHCLAKGARMDRMFAELFGRRDGYCAGKGGSQHIADFSIGMLGANGIVGSSYGIAAGAALMARRRGTDQVAVAFFGDGAASRGTFHEVMNMAALWKLPVIFLCEHNEYAQWVPARENIAAADIAAFAAPYGVPGVTVDGNDVRAVYHATAAAVARARAGDGPTLLECKTQRYYGHTTSDMQVYRTRDEVKALRERTDPIDHLGRQLAQAGILTPAHRAAIDAAVEGEIKQAVAFALASPFPDADALARDVTAA
ncbi:MAG: thiamine pyrophosphate-dependent dehydrogenase E1 component subunit alpha [Alphaproteobacteria bacterium]|nr:thiamine pyrophosphate-dependent dehydrogenase E1 component subunit alpha [Alphaproteobacteria bacterium]